MARALTGFTGDAASLRAWLYTIARRRVLDAHRWRRRHPTAPLPDEQDEPAPRWGDQPGTAEVVETHEETIDFLGRIAGALPTSQRDAVLLQVVAGLSVAETAAVLGRSPAAVSVLTHRALRRLAAALDEDVVHHRPADAEHPSRRTGA